MKKYASPWIVAFIFGGVALPAIAVADEACESRCRADWPREYVHAVPRKACIAKCWAADKAAAAADAARRAAEAAWSAAATVKKAAKEKVSSAVEKVKEKVEAVKSGASKTWDAAKTKARETWDAAKTKARETWEAAKTKAKQTWDAARRKTRDAVDKAKDLYERGKRWVKDRYERGKRWVKDRYERGKRWVSGRARSAKDWVKKALRGGARYVREQVAEGWKAIASLDCEKLVETASNLDPTTILMKQVPGLGTCAVAARKGFWCSIPDTVKELGKVVAGSAKAAWENKGKCITAGLATTLVLAPGAGTAMCGLYHYAAPKVKKLGRCISQLLGSKTFWRDLKAMFKSEKSEKSLKSALLAGVCKFLGSLALDVVITVATEGASLPSTVSKWLAFALPMGTKILPKAGVTLAKGVQLRRYGGLAALILKNAPQCQ